MEQQFLVGYDRQVITPEESIPLGGYSNEPKRFHNRITEDICATAIALTDAQDNTVVLMALDFVTNVDSIVGPAKERICSQLGLREDRVYITVSHTHSGPGFAMEEHPGIQKFIAQTQEKMLEAVKNAMADRKPAAMEVGSLETKNMNFIKHYKAKDLKTGEISYIGDQFGTVQGKRLVSHATVVDPTMHSLRFTREGGKDVVVVNFRAHPHFTGGYAKYDLSSDYIGAFRMALEAMCDCHAAYFQGACGNVNSSTRMFDERVFSTCRSYGTALAAFALEGLGNHMISTPTGTIRTVRGTMQGELYRAPEALREPAQMIRRVWAENFDRDECVRLGEPYGIRGPYHAGAILNSYNRPPESGKIEINAVAIGDQFAFVTYPGEMFDSISARMEENSPFYTTMMLGYAEHNVSYLPSRVAYKYTSYETDITRFACGTGEKVADFQVQLLEQLKK